MENGNGRRVCVTGAAGYIGSSLVKKLLERGHVVHATIRNLGENSKTQLLKGLPGAETRLRLFSADIYEPANFEHAIQGCEFVFLVATPFQHDPHNIQYKDTTEASVGSIRSIIGSCERLRSVKRVIYTGSVTASSPLNEDGIGYKDFIDESCWTPLNLSYAHCSDLLKDYTTSKSLSEKELLSYKSSSGLELVSLVCGLVGGDSPLPYVPATVGTIVGPLAGDPVAIEQLKFLQALLGSVPLIHIDDVCEAHVFCMEMPSMSGRFLCVRATTTMQEMVEYLEKKYSDIGVIEEVEGNGGRTECRSTKLVDMGFKFVYDEKQILDDSVGCAMRLGGIQKVFSL